MNQKAFLQQIADCVTAEQKKLQATGETAANTVQQGQDFEREFRELCAKHKFAGIVFAINENVPSIYQSVFNACITPNLAAPKIAMGIHQFFITNKFGQSVSYAMAMLNEYLLKIKMAHTFDKNLPPAPQSKTITLPAAQT